MGKGPTTIMGQTGPPPMVPGKTYLNPGQEDQMEIVGYKLNKCKYYLSWLLYVLTVGLLRLLFYWLPHLMVQFTHRECSLDQAEKVIMKDHYDQSFVSTVKTEGPGQGTDEPLVYNSSGKGDVIGLEFPQSKSLITPGMRWFKTKKVKYIWDPHSNNFQKLRGLEDGYKFSYYHQLQGFSTEEQVERRYLYGINKIAVHVVPIVVLLFKEVLSPFYIFQLFSMILWYLDEYEIYATCILFISTISIIITIWETRKFQRALRNTISSSTVVTVGRGNDEFHDVSSEDLVPGDVIEIPRRGCIMQCDAVLISGNCIVNESMLTGESVPITKTSIPNPMTGSGVDETSFSMQKHSRHVLFSGTDVIQTRFYGSQRVRAIVLRTGYLTSKGELVRSILYPKPVDFKFQRHSYYFILVLAAMACIGFIYTIILMVDFGDSAGDIIIRSLDLVTITVPPALPAALAMGIVFAQRRLVKLSIYCISPRNINICGTVNTVCFDKTGTLTEDGLNMQGVVPAHGAKFDSEVCDMSQMKKGPLLEAMATCHSLTIIEGQLMGDPLDLIMFNATNWELEEPGEEQSRFDTMVPTVVRPKHQPASQYSSTEQLKGEDLGIVRQFPFSSSLQRMSVITRQLGAQNFVLYVKGSPEMVASLSSPDSVPIDFHSVLTSYTQHGYRVIALAQKNLPSKLTYPKIQRLQREQVECDLTFLGLLVMENRLKPETTPVIHQLAEANIRTIMVTGDNMLTALSVARECGMVDRTDKIILVQAFEPEANRSHPEIEFYYAGDRDTKVEEVNKTEGSSVINIDEDSQRFHFAVTGKSWGIIRQYQPELLSKLVVKGTVFARMSPDQKAQLVEVLQGVGYYVGMCGDGANDCGALKAAHTGISLSEAEASVASPFTSKKPTIECVPAVIKEGRCSLVTAFGIFKYMASYSLTQFSSVLILYWIGANLTDPEFLWIDLFIISTLFITFSRTEPHVELAKQSPPVSLVSPGPILSILSQMVLMVVPQVLVFLHIQQQPWFVPFNDNDEDDYVCHENAAVFLISAYQYIILSVTYSKGAPFRKTIFSNWLFLANIILCAGATMWITLYPTEKFAEIMELATFPSMSYKALLVGVAAITCLLSVGMEMYVVDSTSLREKCGNWVAGCCKLDQYEYAAIESKLKDDPSWPPVSSKNIDLAAIFQRLDSTQQIPPDQININGSKLEHILEQEDGNQSDQGARPSATSGVDMNNAAGMDYQNSADNENLLIRMNSHNTDNTYVDEIGRQATRL
ncbi:polyamine-transporting ATPase 13A3-like isoform X2 [Littorina saxatilis]|uniref:polyamine-transporting ATPase 13A3-like isoform X2 n=1 Tax=Littorina saxatilis TaxID=31220 RepID=UPI0038B66B01